MIMKDNERKKGRGNIKKGEEKGERKRAGNGKREKRRRGKGKR